VCLLAVLLLWAPYAAAALQAKDMACCGGGMCAAHRHVKPEPASRPADGRMDCDHSGGQTHDGMTNCSLSCCKESNPVMAAAAIFVLPEPAALSQPGASLNTRASSRDTEFAQSFEPPSPPPRISSLAD